MLCIGHRGAMGHEPENTLRSVRKALSLGVDAIEIDVYNVENRLVVIHDRRLERTTNGTGDIRDRGFNYLRSLDAGKGERIPTLEEVCDTINRQAIINIELKGSGTAKLVVESIQRYIEKGWSYDDFLVSSFNHYELLTIKQTCDRIPLGILIYGLPLDYLDIARKLNAIAIIVNLDFANKELVASIQQSNFKIFVYTANETKDINKMRQLNIDGIVTNYPERVTPK